MQPIVIKDFNKGIGKSEFLGNGEIRNCDLNWRPGVVRISYESLNQSAGTVTSLPTWIVPNEAVSGQQWASDNSGNVYRGTASTQWSKEFSLATAALGATVWKNHLFLARNSNLMAYGPLNGSATLYSFQSIQSDTAYHPMLVGQDDILYGGAGRYVFSLSEVTGTTFAAGTASTYAWNAQALDLPQDYRVRSLAELGKYLEIGAWKGTNIYDFKIADIFPWDRTSDTFNLPLRLSENGVHAMKNINNLLYVFAGTEGKLLATDGSSIQELAKIPQHVKDLTGGVNMDISPASMIYHDGKIIFASNNDFQVWSYNLSTGALIVENTPSVGTTNISIGGLLSVNRDQYIFGWSQSGGTKGIDLVGNSSRYSSYSSFVTSPYLVIGSRETPQVLSEMEVCLARPLASGQGVKVSFRTDLSAGWTLIDTVDFATYGAIQNNISNLSGNFEIQNGIQVRAELTTGSSASNSPELTQIIFR